MARLQRKDMANPDEVREFPGGSRVEIFQLEDVVVGRTVWQPEPEAPALASLS